MKIIDINNKERDVQYAKKIMHQVEDIHGNIVDEEYIEVAINGRTGRVWKEWYPSKDFILKNPECVYV